MIKALVNGKEQVLINPNGSISTDAGEVINTKVWRAKELLIKADDTTKTLPLSDAKEAIGKEAWIRTEEHGCAKLDRVQVMEVTDVVKA